MFLKMVRILIVLAILFSYIPISRMHSCPDEGHMNNMKMNCGYIFHCPFISNIDFSELTTIPNIGRLVLITSLPFFEDLEYPVFRPPETLSRNPLAS
jgi:hypothetical protein